MRSILAGFLLILSVASASAQDFRAGEDAFRARDFAAALREFRPLAEQGHAAAQYRLGTLYEYGRAVAQDDGEAVKWYRRAATKGIAAAQYRLGILHDNGWGLARDDTEAVKWYRMAALQGHDYAQFDLGLMFAAGTGVAQDNIEAYKWISLAIAQGNEHMIKHRNRLERTMTDAQIAQARHLARQWSRDRR